MIEVRIHRKRMVVKLQFFANDLDTSLITKIDEIYKTNIT